MRTCNRISPRSVRAGRLDGPVSAAGAGCEHTSLTPERTNSSRITCAAAVDGFTQTTAPRECHTPGRGQGCRRFSHGLTDFRSRLRLRQHLARRRRSDPALPIRDPHRSHRVRGRVVHHPNSPATGSGPWCRERIKHRCPTACQRRLRQTGGHCGSQADGGVQRTGDHHWQAHLCATCSVWSDPAGGDFQHRHIRGQRHVIEPAGRCGSARQQPAGHRPVPAAPPCPRNCEPVARRTRGRTTTVRVPRTARASDHPPLTSTLSAAWASRPGPPATRSRPAGSPTLILIVVHPDAIAIPAATAGSTAGDDRVDRHLSAGRLRPQRLPARRHWQPSMRRRRRGSRERPELTTAQPRIETPLRSVRPRNCVTRSSRMATIGGRRGSRALGEFVEPGRRRSCRRCSPLGLLRSCREQQRRVAGQLLHLQDRSSARCAKPASGEAPTATARASPGPRRLGGLKIGPAGTTARTKPQSICLLGTVLPGTKPDLPGRFWPICRHSSRTRSRRRRSDLRPGLTETRIVRGHGQVAHDLQDVPPRSRSPAIIAMTGLGRRRDLDLQVQHVQPPDVLGRYVGRRCSRRCRRILLLVTSERTPVPAPSG